MMPCKYKATDGSITTFDLDAVTDVIAGFSGIRRTWSATIVFVPATGAFVELRSSPQDIRGNSQSEAEEVSSIYLQEAFELSEIQQSSVKIKPNDWRFIDRRTSA